MKKLFGTLCLVSLLVGGAVTFFYAPTQASWRDYDDCRLAATDLTIQVNNVLPCSGVEYGLPLKFVSTKSTIGVQKSDNPRPSINDVVVGSTAKFNYPNLFVDWLIWSALSAVVLFYPLRRIRGVKKTKKTKKTSSTE